MTANFGRSHGLPVRCWAAWVCTGSWSLCARERGLAVGGSGEPGAAGSLPHQGEASCPFPPSLWKKGEEKMEERTCTFIHPNVTYLYGQYLCQTINVLSSVSKMVPV